MLGEQARCGAGLDAVAGVDAVQARAGELEGIDHSVEHGFGVDGERHDAALRGMLVNFGHGGNVCRP